MGPHRQLGWEARLSRYLASARHKPFTRGEHDCVFFTAGAINAQCCTRYGESMQGRASTVYGVSRLIYALTDGEVSLEVLFDRFLGRSNRVPLALAARGFPLVTRLQGAPTAGILATCRTAYFAGPDGLTEQPLAAHTTLWRLHPPL